MSFSKTKKFLAAGLLLAMALTLPSTASAWDGRLWKPYQPEQFGGNRRSADGLYGSVEGIYWKISRPNSTWIGYTNPDGTNGTREAYTGLSTVIQTNSMNVNAADSDYTLGTRIEFGNYRGHHGWLVSGYGLPKHSTEFSQVNATMVINDSLTMTTYTPYVAGQGFNEVFVPGSGGDFRVVPLSASSYLNPHASGVPVFRINDVGYLWGWYPIEWADWLGGRLAPLPINFARASVTNRTGLSSIELMYTYRPHPFKWGEMELLAGARYWGMSDQMSFLGEGYFQEESDDDDANNPGNTNANDAENGYSGPLTVLGTTSINGHVVNRISGPQFGIKLSRRNQRWTFGAEFRFMAGINSQSQTVSGVMGSNFVNPALVPPEPRGDLPQGDLGIHPYAPIGLLRNGLSFYHHQNKTYFSPGIDFRLNAKWQWTDAVGINFGVNSMFVDNVARGASIIDYSIQPDGTLFGIRGNQNQSVLVYGLHIGLTARR